MQTKEFVRLDHVLKLVDQLQDKNQIYSNEQSLCQLETQLIHDNFRLIINTAKNMKEQFIANPRLLPPQSTEDACIQRYIYVPILYKLGCSQEAAELAQVTFEYLFPLLHQTMLNKIHELFGERLDELKNNIIKEFTIEHNNILRVYARMKSTNSIWKKVGNLQKFQSMNLVGFAELVHDFIALRWNMKVNENENRYDAVINGIRLLPRIQIRRFRNQQIQQSSGFSREPVMKFYYIIRNVPVELQLLGGFIELYMSAKGYADYKIGHSFIPSSLTETEQNNRLGLCIYYGEQGLVVNFRKLMLQELTTSKKLFYNNKHAFKIDAEPHNAANRLLRFVKCAEPIYLLREKHEILVDEN